MAQLAHETVLEVDFNNVDALDRVVGSLRFSNHLERPKTGDWLRLIDGEGNTCVAQVDEIRNLIVSLRPDWTTWTSSTVTHRYLWSAAAASRTDEPATQPAGIQ